MILDVIGPEKLAPLETQAEYQQNACIVFLSDLIMSPPARDCYGAEPATEKNRILNYLGVNDAGASGRALRGWD